LVDELCVGIVPRVGTVKTWRGKTRTTATRKKSATAYINGSIIDRVYNGINIGSKGIQVVTACGVSSCVTVSGTQTTSPQSSGTK
jgi:hypothetical protein